MRLDPQTSGVSAVKDGLEGTVNLMVGTIHKNVHRSIYMLCTIGQLSI